MFLTTTSALLFGLWMLSLALAASSLLPGRGWWSTWDVLGGEPAEDAPARGRVHALRVVAGAGAHLLLEPHARALATGLVRGGRVDLGTVAVEWAVAVSVAIGITVLALPGDRRQVGFPIALLALGLVNGIAGWWVAAPVALAAWIGLRSTILRLAPERRLVMLAVALALLVVGASPPLPTAAWLRPRGDWVDPSRLSPGRDVQVLRLDGGVAWVLSPRARVFGIGGVGHDEARLRDHGILSPVTPGVLAMSARPVAALRRGALVHGWVLDPEAPPGWIVPLVRPNSIGLFVWLPPAALGERWAGGVALRPIRLDLAAASIADGAVAEMRAAERARVERALRTTISIDPVLRIDRDGRSDQLAWNAVTRVAVERDELAHARVHIATSARVVMTLDAPMQGFAACVAEVRRRLGLGDAWDRALVDPPHRPRNFPRRAR